MCFNKMYQVKREVQKSSETVTSSDFKKNSFSRTNVFYYFHTFNIIHVKMVKNIPSSISRDVTPRICFPISKSFLSKR